MTGEGRGVRCQEFGNVSAARGEDEKGVAGVERAQSPNLLHSIFGYEVI